MTTRGAKRPERRAKTGASGPLEDLLRRDVRWTRTGNAIAPFGARVGREEWRVRVNDFPDDQMYTLVINDRDAGGFDDWPAAWTRSEADPVVFRVRESDVFSKSLEEMKAELERELILAALARAKGNAATVARKLRIGRSVVRRALKNDEKAG